MPPILALVLTLLFIAFLFKREFKQAYVPSLAILIPSIYLFILGSRSVTEWVNLGTNIRGMDVSEGSPLDRTVFLILIVVGLLVLFKRRISWSRVFRQNIWITLFFLYCGISLAWSDFPDIGFKRWIKGVGDPIMVLIILTEAEPIKALQFVLKTCIYPLIPLSVLFIKYYPRIGRGYDQWTGQGFNTGVTTNKNLLGFVLLVSGLFLLWRLSQRWKAGSHEGNRLDNVGIPLLLICMVGWLFLQANSKTSLLGFILGSCVYLSLGLRNIRAHIGGYLIAAVLAFILLQVSFDVYGLTLRGAGRDATLTGRTELWVDVVRLDPKPLFGHGFESFWLGDKLKILYEKYNFRPNQAHNGYIEVYLNLGWVGLGFLGGLLLSSYFRIKEQLTSALEMNETKSFARFGMAFLATYIVYNYTEAAFKSLHFLFIIFLLCTMKNPQRQQRPAQYSTVGLPHAAERIRRVTGVM